MSRRPIRSANGRPKNTLSVLVIPSAGTRGAKLHDGMSRAARGFSFSWAVIELWWLHRIVRKEYLRVALSHDLNAANEQYVERCARAIILTPSFDSHLYSRTGLWIFALIEHFESRPLGAVLLPNPRGEKSPTWSNAMMTRKMNVKCFVNTDAGYASLGISRLQRINRGRRSKSHRLPFRGCLSYRERGYQNLRDSDNGITFHWADSLTYLRSQPKILTNGHAL